MLVGTRVLIECEKVHGRASEFRTAIAVGRLDLLVACDDNDHPLVGVNSAELTRGHADKTPDISGRRWRLERKQLLRELVQPVTCPSHVRLRLRRGGAVGLQQRGALERGRLLQIRQRRRRRNTWQNSSASAGW